MKCCIERSRCRGKISFQNWNTSAATCFSTRCEGDGIEKPLGPAGVGDVLSPVGEEHTALQLVPVESMRNPGAFVGRRC